MVAPAATPPAIVAALHKITTEAMADPTVKEKLASSGRDAGRRYAGAFPRLHRQRNQEMGEGDQGRGRRDDEVSVTTSLIYCCTQDVK